MRRVLLVQPSLQPPGGGNGVAAWILQALAAQNRVTVLSWEPVAVDPIDRFFGTSLRQADFDRLTVPRPWRLLTDHLPVPTALLHLSLLMRAGRRAADGFDVAIGAHNEADYGRRSIQYVHYPTYFRPRPTVDIRWYHRPRALLHAYYRIADRIADISVERLRSNLMLANSDWTAARLRQSLGVAPVTLYPPVLATEGAAPWASRTPGFLAIGRLSREKEYERIIRILARVRRQVPAVTLTIIGSRVKYMEGYYRRLRAIADRHGSWISWRLDVPRDELTHLMATHRYGIHGMREEHFGMAPAEMMRAGMIVWVPDGGGQVEIVGRDSRLVYRSEEEAADQIQRVVTSPVEQRALGDYLATRGAIFSPERFVRQIRELVEAFTAAPSA